MSDHVQLTIRQAIRYGLLSIQKDSILDGYIYNRSIKYAAKPVEDPEQFPFLDAVVIYMEEEECMNQNSGSHTQSGANQAILENTFEFTLVNYMHEVNDIEQAQLHKLADIQKYFGVYYYIPSSKGVRTVFNCIYAGHRKFGYEATKPNCGIEIRFRVWYRQLLTNPTVLA